MISAKRAARVLEYLSLQTDGTPIDITRLNKLLYFTQGHALAELGYALFTNEIDAWNFGPVVSVVYSNFKKIVEKTERDGIGDIPITPEEMDLIMDVWEQYRTFSASELVRLTHKEGTPWKAVYDPKEKNKHIPMELIREYFSRPENRLHTLSEEVAGLPAVNALPAEDYDPGEDPIWEAQLNDTP